MAWPTYYQPLATVFRFLFKFNIISESFLRIDFKYIFRKPEPNLYLNSTYLANSNHRLVNDTAAGLIQETKWETIEAMMIYAHKIEYNLDALNINWRQRKASDIIERGYGVCSDKAILLTALLRASNIPARYIEGTLAGLTTTHGWVEVYYWGAWRIIDPTNSAFFEFTDQRIPSGPFKGEFGTVITMYNDIFDADVQAKIRNNYWFSQVANLNNGDPYSFRVIEYIFDWPW